MERTPIFFAFCAIQLVFYSLLVVPHGFSLECLFPRLSFTRAGLAKHDCSRPVGGDLWLFDCNLRCDLAGQVSVAIHVNVNSCEFELNRTLWRNRVLSELICPIFSLRYSVKWDLSCILDSTSFHVAS